MRRTLILFSALLLCFGFLACNSDVGIDTVAPTEDLVAARMANADSPQTIPPNASPYGQSYEEWAEDWWRWLWSADFENSPVFDETGENIDFGQSGSV